MKYKEQHGYKVLRRPWSSPPSLNLPPTNTQTRPCNPALENVGVNNNGLTQTRLCEYAGPSGNEDIPLNPLAFCPPPGFAPNVPQSQLTPHIPYQTRAPTFRESHNPMDLGDIYNDSSLGYRRQDNPIQRAYGCTGPTDMYASASPSPPTPLDDSMFGFGSSTDSAYLARMVANINPTAVQRCPYRRVRLESGQDAIELVERKLWFLT